VVSAFLGLNRTQRRRLTTRAHALLRLPDRSAR
jgi:hypothetical protein